MQPFPALLNMAHQQNFVFLLRFPHQQGGPSLDCGLQPQPAQPQAVWMVNTSTARRVTRHPGSGPSRTQHQDGGRNLKTGVNNLPPAELPTLGCLGKTKLVSNAVKRPGRASESHDYNGTAGLVCVGKELLFLDLSFSFLIKHKSPREKAPRLAVLHL